MIAYSRQARGFTLIEIMLVVFIIGVMAAGVAMLATRDQASVHMKAQGRVLQAVLRELQSYSMVHQRLVGLRFLRDRWQAVELAVEGEFLTWGLDPSVEPQDQPLYQVQEGFLSEQASQQSLWQPLPITAHALPTMLEMALFFEGAQESMLTSDPEAPPQVLVNAQGEVTPFAVLLRAVASDDEVLFEISPDGRVVDVGAEADGV